MSYFGIDLVDIDLGFGLANDKSDDDESESMWFHTIHSGLWSIGAWSKSELDKGSNGEELQFDSDEEQFAASLDKQVFASSVTTMSSEMAGSYSGFMAFTTVFL